MDATKGSTLSGVALPHDPQGCLWDVTVGSQSVSSVEPHHCSSMQKCEHSVLLPAMCHPHIHLDKAFLLSSEKYQEFAPQEGSFTEALKNTAAAKARFDTSDLILRGSWVIEESLAAGVTAMRAFVEVDETVGLMCVEAALQLKQDYQQKCIIQICAFAQDPIFSGTHGDGNRRLLEQALGMKGVDVVGTTPYVEDSVETAKRNISWAIDIALRMDKHLDFHLDYNLNEESKPMIWTVVDELEAVQWAGHTGKSIAIGHSTRMTHFSDVEMKSLAKKIQAAHLKISFIGLPTSDLYMMGRPGESDHKPNHRPRGTLQIPSLIRDYGLQGAMGVNNVGNAFTPYGSLDPLRLTCLGVGLYHAGTADDAALLYECVSTRARVAIGLPLEYHKTKIEEGVPINFLRIKMSLGTKVSLQGRAIPVRLQKGVADLVWDPPSEERRTVIFVPPEESF